MPRQPAFAKLVRDTNGDLRGLIGQYHAGKLTADELGEELFDKLRNAHEESYVLGARQAGSTLDADALRDLARSSGRSNADEQNTFFDKFISDLEDGRYSDEEGNLNLAAINRRADYYGQRLRGTAEQAFVDQSDDDASFTWAMGAVEHHCSECPRMAALSPYTANELFTTPGQFDLECGPGCKCHLIRNDGVRCFQRA